jgi:hypothetical protein
MNLGVLAELSELLQVHVPEITCARFGVRHCTNHLVSNVRANANRGRIVGGAGKAPGSIKKLPRCSPHAPHVLPQYPYPLKIRRDAEWVLVTHKTPFDTNLALG